MKQIYSQCSKVTIYLGDGKNHRPKQGVPAEPKPAARATFHGDDRDLGHVEAFWDDLAIGRHLSWSFHLFCLIRILTSRELTSALVAELAGPKADHLGHLVENLRMMLISPWWQRIWVVQEMVVSKRAFIHYGPVSAPWEMFVAALPQISTTSFPPDSTKVLTYFTRQVRDFERLRSEWHSRGGAPLLSLLQGFSSRRASDERDKVFALLGLVTESQQGLVQPDYGAEVSEVYRSTALALVNDSGTLSIWNGDVARKNAMSLPSWIPDWSATCEEPDRRRAQVEASYNACGAWALRVIKSHSEYLRYVASGLEKLTRFLESSRQGGELVHPGLSRALGRYYEKLQEYEGVLEMEFTTGFYETTTGVQDMSQLRTLSTRVRNSCSRLRTLSSTTGSASATHGQGTDWYQLSSHMFSCSSVLCGEVSKMRPIKVLHAKRDGRCIFNPPIWAGEELLTVPPQTWRQRLEVGPGSSTNVLVIETMPVGMVTKVGPRLITWDDVDSAFATLYRWLGIFFEVQNLELARTLVADALVLKGGERSSEGQTSNIELRRLNADDDKLLTSWLDRIGELMRQGREYAAQHFRVDRNMKGLDEALVLATEGRALFQLMGPTHAPLPALGLGPGSMAQGDHVRILPGGKNHVVLRPAETGDYDGDMKEFTVVGDCFLNSEDERKNIRKPPIELALDFEGWWLNQDRRWPGWLPPDLLTAKNMNLGFTYLDPCLRRRERVCLI